MLPESLSPARIATHTLPGYQVIREPDAARTVLEFTLDSAPPRQPKFDKHYRALAQHMLASMDPRTGLVDFGGYRTLAYRAGMPVDVVNRFVVWGRAHTVIQRFRFFHAGRWHVGYGIIARLAQKRG